MKRKLLLASIMALVPVASAFAQNVAGGGVFPPNEVDQVKVDLAIEKGIKYLKANNASYLQAGDHVGRKMGPRELVLFTYVHADVPETDANFKLLFDEMMKDKLEATYCVALQAMVLEEVERVKHQKRIAQCAKFLVDNQGPEGFWSYGSPSIYVEDLMYDIPKRKEVASAGGTSTGGVKQFELATPGMRTKPKVTNKIKIKKDRDGEGHDNSNTQYAALGMRACIDSGIQIEDKVIDSAIKWLRDCQKRDKEPAEDLIEGGINGPDGRAGAKPGVASGGGATVAGPSAVKRKAVPQGWCYCGHEDGQKAYGSMTAGAIGSLSIWDYIKDNDEGKKRSWKNDTDVHEGLVWLGKNFSVTENPGFGNRWYLYYMYALERAGMLYGTEMMGTHKWYPEGAKVLIETQGADGHWGDGTIDTCFAILFLKRATRSLGVVTYSAGQMRDGKNK